MIIYQLTIASCIWFLVVVYDWKATRWMQKGWFVETRYGNNLDKKIRWYYNGMKWSCTTKKNGWSTRFGCQNTPAGKGLHNHQPYINHPSFSSTPSCGFQTSTKLDFSGMSLDQEDLDLNSYSMWPPMVSRSKCLITSICRWWERTPILNISSLYPTCHRNPIQLETWSFDGYMALASDQIHR